jgi:hypothetical protein
MPVDAAKALVQACEFRCLAYCRLQLSSVTETLILRLQSVKNVTAVCSGPMTSDEVFSSTAALDSDPTDN